MGRRVGAGDVAARADRRERQAPVVVGARGGVRGGAVGRGLLGDVARAVVLRLHGHRLVGADRLRLLLDPVVAVVGEGRGAGEAARVEDARRRPSQRVDREGLCAPAAGDPLGHVAGRVVGVGLLHDVTLAAVGLCDLLGGRRGRQPVVEIGVRRRRAHRIRRGRQASRRVVGVRLDCQIVDRARRIARPVVQDSRRPLALRGVGVGEMRACGVRHAADPAERVVLVGGDIALGVRHGVVESVGVVVLGGSPCGVPTAGVGGRLGQQVPVLVIGARDLRGVRGSRDLVLHTGARLGHHMRSLVIAVTGDHSGRKGVRHLLLRQLSPQPVIGVRRHQPGR